METIRELAEMMFERVKAKNYRLKDVELLTAPYCPSDSSLPPDRARHVVGWVQYDGHRMKRTVWVREDILVPENLPFLPALFAHELAHILRDDRPHDDIWAALARGLGHEDPQEETILNTWIEPPIEVYQ